MPIAGLAHINLTVPPGTLPLATEFYGQTLGLIPRSNPATTSTPVQWFDIGDSGQQVHVAHGKPTDFENESQRHPCFKLGSTEELLELRERVYEHFIRGGEAAPREADKPGERNSGSQGADFPQRFFARDFAGNRLEFSV